MIGNLISDINTRKSCGPFNIPVTILKIMKDYISEPLTFLANDSFTRGNFADKFKNRFSLVFHERL